MLGSMYSAVSGMSAHQTKMNVIGNNIANVNTYGYKSSRVTFSDVFYQTINGASAPTQSSGGTNPTQLGYGAKVNSIDVINTRAGSATTDRALDIYINGDGYLATRNSDGQIKYTRVGVLSFDSSGNLVDANGNNVLGFQLDGTTKNALLESDGTTTVQKLMAISIDPAEFDKYTGIAIGQNGEITGIKEGDPVVTPAANTSWITGAPNVSASSLYNGNVKFNITQSFSTNPVYTGSGTPVEISSDADIGTGAVTLSLDNSGEYTLTYPNGSAKAQATDIDTSTTPNTLTFSVTDKDGGATATCKVELSTTASLGYNPTAGGAAVPLGDVTPTTYNITATTYDKSGATVTLHDTWDSTAATPDTTLTFGDMTFTIDDTAFQTALAGGMTNTTVATVGPGAGISEKIAQIAVVNFINPNGLSQEGQGYYSATTNSGNAVATIPGNNGTGNFRSGALEMSNVDLAREFTEMIITQRGFQANTKMITTSDEMLSELVSMKR